MTARVIDNFISQQESDNIRDFMLSGDMPWFFNNAILDPDNDIRTHAKSPGEKDYQFTHQFYRNYAPSSDYFYSLLTPILEKINAKALIKVKANLSLGTEDPIEGGYHTDYDFDCKTAVYYVNTNNGYTKFEDGQTVESLQNRFVEFDSNTSHTGATCTDQKSRVVINFNYFA